MQQQDVDGSVYWVAWLDGIGPCSNHPQLSIKQMLVCGQSFSVGNFALTWAGCEDVADGSPSSVQTAEGEQV